MKLAIVVGARPQFIKAAALSRAILQSQKKGYEIHEIIIHTGQHYDQNMSEVFFKQMGIPQPHYHLGIGGCSQGAMTGRMLESIEQVLIKEKPDWTVIFGDTNSTLAGALAATKLHLPVAHIEAGLRSFNRRMPEEINRILADHCSDLLFTPSLLATNQLLKENIDSCKICEVGDIMYDVAKHYQERAVKESSILRDLELTPKNYVLATLHRQENIENPTRLLEILAGLAAISKKTPVVIPLHPRTKQAIEKISLKEQSALSNLTMLDPLGYLDMINLQTHAQIIATDSGGIQKEAYFFHVPCLTLRDETEWGELVQHGFNQLVPADRQEILKKYSLAVSKPIAWTLGLYGHGHTAPLIVEALLQRQ